MSDRTFSKNYKMINKNSFRVYFYEEVLVAQGYKPSIYWMLMFWVMLPVTTIEFLVTAARSSLTPNRGKVVDRRYANP